MSVPVNPNCAPAWQRTRKELSEQSRPKQMGAALERAKAKQEGEQQRKWRGWLEWLQR